MSLGLSRASLALWLAACASASQAQITVPAEPRGNEPVPATRPSPQPSPLPLPTGGFRVIPSLGVAEVYDDNLFFTPEPAVSDFIHRFEPGLELGYREPQWNVLGRYFFDAELYAQHHELNTTSARQEGEIALTLDGRTTSSTTRGAYYKTLTPGELNRLTAVQIGRIEATRYAASELIVHRFGARTLARLQYDFSRDSLVGQLPIITHEPRLEFERGLGPRDDVTLAYILRVFDFGGPAVITSNVVTVGWGHNVSPGTRFEVRAGPRNTDGNWEPEIWATLRRRFRTGEIAAAYVQTETTALGEQGLLNTRGGGLTFLWQPSRRFDLSTGPGFYNDRGGGFTDIRVFRVESQATLRATSWLSFTGSHQLQIQRGSFRGPGRDELHHQVLFFRVAVQAPTRTPNP
jgi:hypothetical protein